MKLKRQNGFTLLEAIFVVVIIVILMVISLPRYTDFIEKAKVKVIQYVQASGCSNVTMAYSREILSNGKPPTMDRLYTILTDKSAGYATIGAFTVEYTMVGATGIKVRVTGSSFFDMPMGGPFEKTILLVNDGG